MLCCVGSGLFHVPIAVYMMIFVPNTIETLDKLPDVQVGPDADAITVIPMGQGSVKLFIFVCNLMCVLTAQHCAEACASNWPNDFASRA